MCCQTDREFEGCCYLKITKRRLHRALLLGVSGCCPEIRTSAIFRILILFFNITYNKPVVQILDKLAVLYLHKSIVVFTFANIYLKIK